MTTEHDRGFAPSIADAEYRALWVWWAEEYHLDPIAARWLALYQYTGGNLFLLTDLDGRVTYAPRAEA